jgi:Na+/phosphate symporter
MIIYLPLLVAFAGALLYGFAKDKLAELGRIAFGCGLLAFLITAGGHTLKVLP